MKDKIEKYLKGKMSKAEIETFEKEVSSNLEIAYEVELQRFMAQTIEHMAKQSLKKRLKSLDQQTNTKNQKQHVLTKRKIQAYLMRIAAGMTLLIGFFGYFSYQYSDRVLIQCGFDNTTAFFSNIRKSVNDAEAETFDSEVLDILIEQKYKEASRAIMYFESYIDENHPLFMLAKNNLAHSFLLNKDYDKALRLFDEIHKSDKYDPRLRQSAEYFAAVASIGLQNEEQTKIRFESIMKNQEQAYQDEAALMLKQLNSFWRRISL